MHPLSSRGGFNFLIMPNIKLPKEIKEQRGTIRKCRELDDPMESSKIDTPEKIKAPTFLNKYGKAFFESYRDKLSESFVLTETDIETLELLSAEYGKYVEAQYKLKKEGYVVKGTNKNGSSYEMVSPWVNIANNAFKNYNSLMGKFGLSPSERQKISKIKEEEIDGSSSLDDFLSDK